MSRPRTESSGCPFIARATEYVRGELRGRDRTSFERHARACAACREEISDLQEILAELASRPPAALEVDVSEAVLGLIPERDWRRWGTRRRAAVWASLAALLVAGAVFWTLNLNAPPRAGSSQASIREPDASALALLQARDWLVSVQEPSGAWEPERWQGDPEYRIALTALAVLALTGDGRETARDSALRAGEFLRSTQDESGHLGPRARSSLYNHAMGTLALVELARSRRSERILDGTRRAVRYLLDTQTAAGAWGYISGSETVNNDSISVWALQALVRARSIGIPVDSRAIERGFDWFESSSDPDPKSIYLGRAGHLCGEGGSHLSAFAVLLRGGPVPAKAARAAMDRWMGSPQRTGEPGFCFYDSYFLVRTVFSAGIPSLQKYRFETQRLLADSQIRSGRFSGSWEPTDRWSPVGGRLYATVLAALALKDPGDHPGTETAGSRSG